MHPCGFRAPSASEVSHSHRAAFGLRVTSCAIGLSLDSVPLRTRGKEPGRSLELHRRFLESIGDQLDTVPGIHSCDTLRSFDPTAERIESRPFNSCPPAVLQIIFLINLRQETFRRLNLKYPRVIVLSTCR